jgi:hypothetical protein
MEEERYDGVFMGVVQNAQGIDNFMDALFSFMRRKTDFFSNETQANSIVRQKFSRHLDLYKEAELEKKARADRLAKAKLQEEKAKRQEEERQSAKVVGVTEEEAKVIEQAPMDIEEVKAEETKEEEGEVPVGNGGRTDRYIWTQTLSEVTMNIFMPSGFNKKGVKLVAGVKSLKITIDRVPFLEGEFPQKVKPDDLVWIFDVTEGRPTISLTIEKFEGMSWWKSALVGDAEINTQKIQPENSKLSDLDGETRSTVEKMMLDQQRKAAGLPSVEEESKQEMLKKFMATHPEMDFSKCKFS